MGTVDYVIIAVIAIIVCGASYYIYRAKKNGKKCIGCPYSDNCQTSNKGCSGSCNGCQHDE